MKLSKTVQAVISCGVFLLFLFLTSSVDLPFTLAGITYLGLSNGKSLPLFVSSIIIYILYLLLNASDVQLRFIFDLSIDAYILFLGGVVIYLKSNKEFLSLMESVIKGGGKSVMKRYVPKFIASAILASLLFPILGGYLASLIAYIAFSILINQFNGKVAVCISLGFLLIAGLFVLGDPKSLLAEDIANYTLFFLFIGTVQEVINLQRSKITESKKMDINAIKSAKHSFSFNIGKLQIYKLFSSNFLKIVVFSALLLVIIFIYLFKQQISSFNLSYVNSLFKKIPAQLSPTPSPTLEPTAIPTEVPLKITTESAKLKIVVQNGTDIVGLAASTSAKLKNAGFINVKAENALKDYTDWELITTYDKQDLGPLLKQILELSDLSVKTASAPAGFDILIIAGSTGIKQ